MTCAGRSRSRSLALPVSARTRRTSSSGNVLAITPRLMWSLTRMPAGRPAGARAIAVARPRASASMDQLHPYVNGIEASPAAGQDGDHTVTGRRSAAGHGPVARHVALRAEALGGDLAEGVVPQAEPVPLGEAGLPLLQRLAHPLPGQHQLRVVEPTQV